MCSEGIINTAENTLYCRRRSLEWLRASGVMESISAATVFGIVFIAGFGFTPIRFAGFTQNQNIESEQVYLREFKNDEG